MKLVTGRITIGIDPGLSGAIAFLPHDAPVGPWVVDMPTIAHSKTGFVKRAVDGVALAQLLSPFTIACDATVYMERVNAFPGQGVGSMFSLGMSFWCVAGVCAGLGLPLHLVEPKDWKGHYGLGRDKELARDRARRLYPAVASDLSRQKDHNRAEALLIAGYGRTLDTAPKPR